MPPNGCGIWNERAMPIAQRRGGDRWVISVPSSSTRPASAATVPVMIPNNVVLPAPFGPMMPSASPGASARSSPSAITTAPKRLEIFSRARMGDIWNRPSVPLAIRHPEVRPRPLRPGEPRRMNGPGRRRDRIEDRFRIAEISGTFEHVDRDLEQCMLEPDRLRPGPLRCARIGVGQFARALAGQPRLERMVRRPPDLGGEPVAAGAERVDHGGEEQRLADGDDLRPEALLRRLRPEGREV